MNPDNNESLQNNPNEPTNQQPPLQPDALFQPQAQAQPAQSIPTPPIDLQSNSYNPARDGIIVGEGFDPTPLTSQIPSQNNNTPDQLNAIAAPVVVGAGIGAAYSNSPNSSDPIAKKSKLAFLKRKAFVMPIAAILILAIGSAAAFYVVIKPNMPASKLQAAFINTLQQKQFSYNATANLDPSSSGSGLAAKVTASGDANNVAQTSDTNINLTISGVSINAEVRYVGQNLYVKFGNLSSLTSLVNDFDPSLSGEVSSFASQISNQWIAVDSTLLKQAGLSCIIDSNVTFTNSDATQLKKDYSKDPFINIKSNSPATVNGAASEQYVLNVNDDKASAFINTLDNLPLVKSVESCQASNSTKSQNIKGDNKLTPVTVWVDKGTKRIDQVEYQPSPSEVAKSGEGGKLILTLGYKASVVSAPASSMPLLSVIANLDKTLGENPSSSTNISGLGNLFSGFSSSSSDSILQ
jgi:hypothetical protein